MPNELHYWSVPVGRLNGVPLRIHLAVILAAILLLGLVSSPGFLSPGFLSPEFLSPGVSGYGYGGGEIASPWHWGLISILTLGIAIGALVLHSIFQLQSLIFPTHSVRSICLLPWGAHFTWQPAATARIRCQVYATGLLGNLGLLACSLLVMAAWFPAGVGGVWSAVDLWSPQLPSIDNLEYSLLMCFAWVNTCLLACRLIPVAPLDMGLLLESWGELRFAHVAKAQRLSIMFLFSLIASVIVLVGTYALSTSQPAASFAQTVGPVVVCVVLVFSARRHFLVRIQSHAEELSKMGDGNRYQSSVPDRRTRPVAVVEEESDPSHWSEVDLHSQWADSPSHDSELDEWMDEHRASRKQARQNQSADEEAMLDAILLKVSESGIQSLTEQERGVLDRLSQLYRRRRELRL